MKTNKYWVYTITSPDGMVYVGRSGRNKTWERWKPSEYKKTPMVKKEIEKWGWKNLKKEVVKSGLSYDESYILEHELILFCKINGVSLNIYDSGGLKCGGNSKEYDKKYRETHIVEIRQYNSKYKKEHYIQRKHMSDSDREAIREYHREYYTTNREKINKRRRELYKKKKEVV